MTNDSVGKNLPLATRLLRRQALIFLVALIGSILIVLVPLGLVFNTMWDEVTQAVQTEIEKEADTIARLLVFEFSHLKELAAPADLDEAVAAAVKRRLWEKVTFNETIRGIELIHGQSDALGRHLTYSYFPASHASARAELGPQITLKSFTGSERELIGVINREQRVDKNLLEAINRGPKLEAEMLLRYFPLYTPLPDQGAIYWGVTKVGINIDSMRRFLMLLDWEKGALRRALLWMMVGGAFAALVLGLAGFRRVIRKTAAPLNDYGMLTEALKRGIGVDITSLLLHLKQQESQGIREFEQVRTLCQRLGESARVLAERLVESEAQACLGRLAGRLAGSIGRPAPEPGAWQSLFLPRRRDWRQVEVEPLFQQISRLLPALLPPGTTLYEDRQPLPPLYGSEAHIVQAVLFILDFSLIEMTPGGQCSWLVSPRETGGFSLEVKFPGPYLAPEAIRRLLQPFQAGSQTLPPLGLFLAAALAQQHLGSLLAEPNPEGGLRVRLEIPDSQLPAAHESRKT